MKSNSYLSLFLIVILSVISSAHEQERCKGEECLEPPVDDQKSHADYDVYNCPSTPPRGYPQQWSSNNVFQWPVNSTDIPETIHQGLCIFDAGSDHKTAFQYLYADVPFVVRNDPDFIATAQRWNQEGYIEDMLGDSNYPTHKSSDFVFKHWTREENPPAGWTEPTEVLRIPYRNYTELSYRNAIPNEPHYSVMPEGYWSLSDETHRWSVFEELPQFKPEAQTPMYQESPAQNPLYQELVADQDTQKLQCQFGMAGNMHVFHFKSSRNTIVLLKGRRRYLLSDPSQCPLLQLHELGHASNRHSSLTELPEALKLNEVVLQQGDVLIIPSYWFHSSIGLTHDNAQCNAWSAGTMRYKGILQKCGKFERPSSSLRNGRRVEVTY